MTSTSQTAELEYQVLINEEEQYCLWPAIQPVPLGWKSVVGPKDKSACLEYIKENWIDMRPKTLRGN